MAVEVNRKRKGLTLESLSKKKVIERSHVSKKRVIDIEDRIVVIDDRVEEVETRIMQLDGIESSDLDHLRCRVSFLEDRLLQFEQKMKHIESWEERIDDLESQTERIDDLDKDVSNLIIFNDALVDKKETKLREGIRYFSTVDKCAMSLYPKAIFVGKREIVSLSRGQRWWLAYFWRTSREYCLVGSAEIIQTLHGYCQNNVSRECCFNFDYILSEKPNDYFMDERVIMFEEINSFLFEKQLLVDKTIHAQSCSCSPRFLCIDGVFRCSVSDCNAKMDFHKINE